MDKNKRPAASLLAFMADLHHEIRSPVNTILNMTELASKEAVPPPVRHYFDTIEKSANSLLTILDDIIELSQDDMDSATGNQQFGLTDLLEDMKETIEGPMKARKANMTLSFEKDVPEWFSGPRGRIRQILTQISNYCMRQLASGDIKLDVTCDNTNRLEFTLFATGCAMEAPQPKDIFRNPRILICQRLLVELGHDLSIERTGNGVAFSFVLNVQPINRPWGEPIFPVPVACIVGTQGISSSLVSRRLMGCGFKVKQASSIGNAQRILDEEVSKSQKGVTLVDWEVIKDKPDAWKPCQAKAMHPVIFFDIPAIRMMHISAEVSETAKDRRKTGFVMAPSKGRQIISELLRLLKMEPGQLSCVFFNEDDSEEEITPVPEDLKGMKVLVVEDDRINQRIVVELLKKFNIKPVVASSGKSALNAAKKHYFDAIFMDINLPDTDGYRVTEEIRKMERYRSTPIIALTASTKNRKLCMEAGMNHFLSKPYSETKLLRSLITTRKA